MRLLSAIAGLLVFSTALLAQELTATVDRTSVRIGERITCTITFYGAASGMTQPELRSLENLKVVSGPSTSTNYSIINGKRRASSSYTYVLAPGQPGVARIGAARVTFKRKIYQTNPINLTVLPASAASTGADAEQDVFIRVYPDKRTAYQGEQIVLTYKLFFALQVAGPEIKKLPKAAGFWVEEFSQPKRLSLTDEVIGGRAYKSAVIRKLAIFPTITGELTVDPMIMRLQVENRSRRRSRDPLDMFSDPFFNLGRRMDNVEVRSPSVKLKVRPLPAEDVPEGFSGVVGHYQLKAKLDQVEVQAHDAVTLRVTIEGDGNIKTLPEPILNVPSDIESYDPKTSERIRRDRGKISGSKTYEYVLIPRSAGDQRIPALRYVYFDADKEQYVVLTTDDLKMKVTPSKETVMGTGGVKIVGKHGVESIATDIAFAKTRPGRFITRESVPHRTAVFWAFTAAPWLILAAGGICLSRRSKTVATLRFRIRKALQRAGREFTAAEKSLKGNQPEEASRLLTSGLDLLVKAGSGLDAVPLDGDELIKVWVQSGFGAETLDKLLALKEKCDRVRFASNQQEQSGLSEMIGQARDVLKSMESGRA